MRLLLAFLFIASTLLADDISIKNTKIHSVTVFQQGAIINRNINLHMEKGAHRLIIQNIDPNINPNSIQIKGVQGFDIISVESQVVQNTEPIKNKQIQVLKDSLQILEVQKKNEINGKFSYEQELNLILKNQDLKGNNTLTIDDVYEFSTLYRKMIPEIKSKILISELLIEKLDRKIDTIHQKINNLNKPQTKRSTEIRLAINVPATQRVSAELSYFLYQASWNPIYDIRTNGIEENIVLNYKGKVTQHSIHPWNNVDITLSTGNPNVSGDAPELTTWRLRHRKSRNIKRRAVRPASRGIYAPQMLENKVMSNDSKEETITSENMTNVDFHLVNSYTIPNNNQGKTVAINTFELNSDYHYELTPKLSKYAYLTAEVTNWRKLNLLPGESAIFFNGSFVSNSYLDPNQNSDTLAISLGVDQGIVVKREKNEDFTKSNFLRGTVSRTFEYKITISNNKSKEVKISLNDQLPVSSDSKITVVSEELSGAQLDPKTGLLIWDMELSPADTNKVTLRYTVTYPKDGRVNL